MLVFVDQRAQAGRWSALRKRHGGAIDRTQALQGIETAGIGNHVGLVGQLRGPGRRGVNQQRVMAARFEVRQRPHGYPARGGDLRSAAHGWASFTQVRVVALSPVFTKSALRRSEGRECIDRRYAGLKRKRRRQIGHADVQGHAVQAWWAVQGSNL